MSCGLGFMGYDGYGNESCQRQVLHCVCVCVLPVPVGLSFQALDRLRPFFALRSHKVLSEPCVTSLSFPVMLPLIIMKENLTK